ncbi:ABC transporter substrate-binding protein [Paracraurococcus ruber]|uniref:Peptide ABC transporter substrate-binding protein n=1 Tax=Paracraurococcus ruber TaxID=77675 RepID=A0ABS1CRW3_9PROT|nr:ABC transporter substrate-binding protein [Paracraurococcus ruber]MBK1657031.1 peptide ABC transporter substrate-binding protein [Paracraurococcus ruber]TDG32527.1 ABC transporter substrate-binding protein [Paracraurococcus ruber]
MRRETSRPTLAAAAALLLAGPAAAQTLTIGVRAGPESIDPHFTATGTHAETLTHVFDTLTRSGPELEILPGIAESWRVLDPTTWEFRLRQGVTFHDGAAMTAEDVAASIRRMQVLSGPNPTRIYVRRVQEVRIIDPHTIHIVTDGPAPTLPNDFIRVFVTKASITAGLTPETSNEAFNTGRAAIGTGPYRFVSWTPREQFVAERYDNYWGGRQPWARHVRREIPNEAARVAQLRTGQVDMIVRAPAADVPTLERDPAIRVVKADTVYVFNFGFDFRETTPQVTAKDGSRLASNPYRDPRVREAIDLAIDRRALAEVAMEGLGTPQGQMVTPTIFGFIPNQPIPTPNIQRARALLAEAGFPNGFRMALNFTNDRLPGDRGVGTAMAQMLARIGLEVQAAGQPAAVIFPQRTRGELSNIMAGWGTLTGEANYTYSSNAHTNNPQLRLGAFNWHGYSNPEMDRLIQAASVELDDAKRRALLQQVGALFNRERIALPLASITSAWALRKDRVDMARGRADEETYAMDIKPAGR